MYMYALKHVLKRAQYYISKVLCLHIRSMYASLSRLICSSNSLCVSSGFCHDNSYRIHHDTNRYRHTEGQSSLFATVWTRSTGMSLLGYFQTTFTPTLSVPVDDVHAFGGCFNFHLWRKCAYRSHTGVFSLCACMHKLGNTSTTMTGACLGPTITTNQSHKHGLSPRYSHVFTALPNMCKASQKCTTLQKMQ